MTPAIEAIIDNQAHLKLLEDVKLSADQKALVIIFDEKTNNQISETALLSEVTLAEEA